MPSLNIPPVEVGDTANPEFFNSRFSAISNLLNGNLDADNLATGAVIDDKIATGAVTESKIDEGAVTAPKLESDAVGHGFLEIGRTTLGSAGDTITVQDIPARKYLRIYINAIASGQIAGQIRFNNDSGNTYSRRNVVGTTVTTDAPANMWNFNSSAASENYYAVIEINNIANKHKLGMADTNQNGASASSAPTYINSRGKWNNTVNQITRVDVINVGSGDFDIGSEVIIYGQD